MNRIVEPLAFSSRRLSEQCLDLLRHEHRGRLVEDQDLGTAVEHLDDLDPLALADLERLDQLVGIDVEPVGLADLAEVRLGLVEVDPADPSASARRRGSRSRAR